MTQHETFLEVLLADEPAPEFADELELFGQFVVRRWIFADVMRESFRWRAVESRDEGRRWELVQEMSARRL